MANFIKHSVKITPLEKQTESPYEWYPHSSLNRSSYGGIFHHSVNIDSSKQFDDVNVPEGGDNLLKDIGGGTHTIEFIVIHNTGDNPMVLKFTQESVGSTSGYKWYLGVSEVWATSPAHLWKKLFGYGINGHTKISLFCGLDADIS